MSYIPHWDLTSLANEEKVVVCEKLAALTTIHCLVVGHAFVLQPGNHDGQYRGLQDLINLILTAIPTIDTLRLDLPLRITRFDPGFLRLFGRKPLREIDICCHRRGWEAALPSLLPSLQSCEIVNLESDNSMPTFYETGIFTGLFMAPNSVKELTVCSGIFEDRVLIRELSSSLNASSLYRLDVELSNGNVPEMPGFFSALGTNQTIGVLELTVFNDAPSMILDLSCMLTMNTSLKMLTLYVHLCDDMYKALAIGVATNRCLEKIVLDGCPGIDDNFALLLAKLLIVHKDHCALKSLDVYNTNVTMRGVSALAATGMLDWIMCSSSGGDSLGDLLLELEMPLPSILLSLNDMGATGVQAIASTIGRQSILIAPSSLVTGNDPTLGVIRESIPVDQDGIVPGCLVTRIDDAVELPIPSFSTFGLLTLNSTRRKRQS